jgi:phage tail-like protein
MAADNSSGTRHDPQTAFCFRVEIAGKAPENSVQAFFKSASGLKSESEVVPYKEGGLNTTTHQLIGPTKWPNIVLKKGFTGDSTFITWRDEFLDDSQGRKLERRGGKICQLNSKLQVVATWHFVGGWPCKWEGPDFDASKSELSIETIEIAHEGLRFEPGSGG